MILLYHYIERMNFPKVSFDLQKFSMIMLFYVFLTYVLGIVIGYYTLGKTAQAAGHGFVIGSVVSILLWYSYVRKLV